MVDKDLEELVKISRGGTTVILDEVRLAQRRKALAKPCSSSTRGTTTAKAKKVFHILPRAMLKMSTRILLFVFLPRSAGSYSRFAKVLIDGLTKNFRLPGFRCCWVIGPEKLVEALSQSGSFLDGGASHPIQLAAIPLLDAKRVQQDKVALQRHFKAKVSFVDTVRI